MSDVVQISDADFDENRLKREGLALVDFWAEWCAPCKAMLPALDEAAETYAGTVAILKLNVTENQESMARFGARTIPLLVLFKDGFEIARSIGGKSMARLSHFIDSNI